VTTELPELRAEFPDWQIDFREVAGASPYYTAFLPGRVVKAPSAKHLRQRLAPADHTARAVAAVADALAAEPDLGGWLAGVLCRVAAAAGGSHELVSGRPGSWEAGYVLALVRGTAGHADEDLTRWRDLDPLPPNADKPGPVAPMVGGIACGKGHGHATQAGADLCDTNPDA
jgi:hypothetical protein